MADTEDREPWTVWRDLPPGSDVAVRMGLVRPIECPGCGGSGRVNSFGDPSVTHGKGGVPPLPAQPDPASVTFHRVEVGQTLEQAMFPPDLDEGSTVNPNESEVPVPLPESRRCAGWPGVWECDAILGPEVAGAVCDHCARNIAKAKAQDVGAEEAWVDCDGCQPERRPLSGKLCHRCRAERRRQVEIGKAEGGARREAHERILANLVASKFLTAQQAGRVRSVVGVVAMGLDGLTSGFTDQENVTCLVLLKDVLQGITDAHLKAIVEARAAEAEVRS